MNSSTMLESVAGWIAQSRKTRPALQSASAVVTANLGRAGTRVDAGGQLI